MKKKILSLLMVSVFAFGVTACGGSTEEAAPSDAASTDAAAGDSTAAWTPESSVSIVVPAGAGGDTDLSARTLAEYGKKLTGVDFVVVNANGGAGSVAANQVKAADPDGLTFLYGHNLVNVANIAGVTDYNYSAFDLGPTFAENPAQQLYVNSEKYADLNAFIKAAKAAPGTLKAATEVGAYTYYELLAFEKAAGIDLDLVDVGSNSDKIAALLSGQVDLMPGAYISTKDYVEAGQFKALGVPSEERFTELLPEVPTFKEQGVDLVYPNLYYSTYFPKGTDPAVIAWYEELVKQVTEDAEAQAAIRNLEMQPYYLNGADSEANDAKIYDEIKAIADSVEQQ